MAPAKILLLVLRQVFRFGPGAAVGGFLDLELIFGKLFMLNVPPKLLISKVKKQLLLLRLVILPKARAARNYNSEQGTNSSSSHGWTLPVLHMVICLDLLNLHLPEKTGCLLKQILQSLIMSLILRALELLVKEKQARRCCCTRIHCRTSRFANSIEFDWCAYS